MCNAASSSCFHIPVFITVHHTHVCNHQENVGTAVRNNEGPMLSMLERKMHNPTFNYKKHHPRNRSATTDIESSLKTLLAEDIRILMELGM